MTCFIGLDEYTMTIPPTTPSVGNFFRSSTVFIPSTILLAYSGLMLIRKFLALANSMADEEGRDTVLGGEGVDFLFCVVIFLLLFLVFCRWRGDGLRLNAREQRVGGFVIRVLGDKLPAKCFC